MALIDINWKPGRRDLRIFGLLFLIFGGIAGTIFYFKGYPLLVSQILWIAAAVVGVLGLLFPPLVRPVYVVMMALALPIGMVVSTILMIVIYFLIMTPIGFLMRLFGYDPLRRRLDPAKASYWIRRAPPAEARRYFRQF